LKEKEEMGRKGVEEGDDIGKERKEMD